MGRDVVLRIADRISAYFSFQQVKTFVALNTIFLRHFLETTFNKILTIRPVKYFPKLFSC